MNNPKRTPPDLSALTMAVLIDLLLAKTKELVAVTEEGDRVKTSMVAAEIEQIHQAIRLKRGGDL